MISVTIKLHSAINGRTTILGRMWIWNRGDEPSRLRGNYGVAVLRKGHEDAAGLVSALPDSVVTRRGEVLNYPRLSYNVWRLIARALKSAFPEEA